MRNFGKDAACQQNTAYLGEALRMGKNISDFTFLKHQMRR